MNIVIFTALYPSKEYPYGGVFIIERLKHLSKANITYNTYVLQPQYSKLIKLGYYIIKKKRLTNPETLQYDDNHKIINIKYNLKLFTFFISSFCPKEYNKYLYSLLSKNISYDSETIFHAHWTYPNGYCLTEFAKKCGNPCLITAHGSDIHTNPKKNKSIKKYTLKALHNADKVIFVSHALLKSAMELGYSGENAVVIPNGIDTSEFYPIENSKSIQKTGFIQTKKYVVGFVGNLIPVKRVDKFAEIFSKIHEEISDVEFIIVGDGYLLKDIKSKCDKLGLIVTFAGRVPHEDVAYWINLFDVMIFPSREEGFGCVVLEANACGVPVVGSEAGGIPEAIGDVGIVVAGDEYFEERLAERVCDVLLGKFVVDKSALIERSRSYSWDKIISKEIEVYKSLIKNK